RTPRSSSARTLASRPRRESRLGSRTRSPDDADCPRPHSHARACCGRERFAGEVGTPPRVPGDRRRHVQRRLRRAARRRAASGQRVGYVGDSGDANGIHPHLHFEVHPNDGAAVDPYPYLRKAQPLMFYAKTNARVSLSLTGTIVSAFAGTLALKTSEIQVDASK